MVENSWLGNEHRQELNHFLCMWDGQENGPVRTPRGAGGVVIGCPPVQFPNRQGQMQDIHSHLLIFKRKISFSESSRGLHYKHSQVFFFFFFYLFFLTSGRRSRFHRIEIPAHSCFSIFILENISVLGKIKAIFTSKSKRTLKHVYGGYGKGNKENITE